MCGLYKVYINISAGCVRIFLPKHCYKKDGIPSRRFFSRNFHVTVNGVDTEVCKQAFLNIHSISNGRLDRLLKKKQEIGNTGFDERGRHSNKVNKIPIEKIAMVRKHIDSIREKAGYFGKRKSKKVEILPGTLNIRTMYRSYRDEMTLKGLEPVCEYRYRKIFHTDFHIDFGKVSTPSNLDLVGNPNKQILLKQSSHEYDELPSQIYFTCDKQINDIIYEKDCNNDKKMEDLIKNVPMHADVNINVQVNADIKTNKNNMTYTQLEGGEDDKLLLTRETCSYSTSEDDFRLDYSMNFNNNN